MLILMVTCLGAGVLMWLERFANYRTDYIFRRHMGLIMPILSLLAIALFGWCLYRFLFKKDPSQKVMGEGFALYLSIAPLMAVVLPALSLLGKHEQLFSMATELVGCALLALFLIPLFYQLCSPSAAALCAVFDIAIIFYLYFMRMYYSDTAFIMAGSDLMKLNDWGCLLLLALLSVGVYLGWLLLCKKKPHFAAPKLITALPLLLSLCGMLTLCIHPLTLLIRTILFWGILGIQILSGLLFIFLKKRK